MNVLAFSYTFWRIIPGRHQVSKFGNMRESYVICESSGTFVCNILANHISWKQLQWILIRYECRDRWSSILVVACCNRTKSNNRLIIITHSVLWADYTVCACNCDTNVNGGRWKHCSSLRSNLFEETSMSSKSLNSWQKISKLCEQTVLIIDDDYISVRADFSGLFTRTSQWV